MAQALVQTRLALLFAAYFGTAGLFLPYWPVWLQAQGFATAEIALLLGMFPWLTVVCSPLVGRFVDRTGARRRTLVGLAVLFLIGYGAMEFASAPWHIVALMILVGMSGAPFNAVVDNLTLIADRGGAPVDYGRIRLWGSVAFIGASSLGGWLLARSGADGVLHALTAGAAIMVLVAFFTPSLSEKAEAAASPGAPAGTPVGKPLGLAPSRIGLLGNPVFLVFLLAAACLQAQHSVLYMYGTLRWREAGVPDTVIGWLWAEGVLAEILLFAVGARVLLKLGPVRLMMLSALAGLIRWPILAETTWLPALIVAQALHGATFGAFHLGAMAFIQRATPRGASGAAQGLYAALVAGVASGLAIPAAGQLAARFGPDAYWAMTGLGVVALVLLRAVMTRWDGGRL